MAASPAAEIRSAIGELCETDGVLNFVVILLYWLGGFDAPGVWTTGFGRRSGDAAQRFAGADCGCFGLGLAGGSDVRGAGGADRPPGLWTLGAAALCIAAAMVWVVRSCA